MKTSTHTTVTWAINKLSPHPVQKHLFAEPTEEEVRRLAADIKEHGLRTPVEILPDGTIVCGHTRVKAYKLLGLTEIDVEVRSDLAEQGAGAVLSRLIDDNQNRRQMSLLELAKCAQIQIDGSLYSKSGKYVEPGESSKAAIAKKLGLHPKKLQRLLRILKTPKDVQDAFSKGFVRQKTALAVAGVPKSVMKEVVALVKKSMAGGGEHTNDLDAAIKALVRPAGKPRKGFQGMSHLFRALQRADSDFATDDQLLAIKPHLWQKHLELFKRSQERLERIIAQLESHAQETIRRAA